MLNYISVLILVGTWRVLTSGEKQLQYICRGLKVIKEEFELDLGCMLYFSVFCKLYKFVIGQKSNLYARHLICLKGNFYLHSQNQEEYPNIELKIRVFVLGVCLELYSESF